MGELLNKLLTQPEAAWWKPTEPETGIEFAVLSVRPGKFGRIFRVRERDAGQIWLISVSDGSTLERAVDEAGIGAKGDHGAIIYRGMGKTKEGKPFKKWSAIKGDSPDDGVPTPTPDDNDDVAF